MFASYSFPLFARVAEVWTLMMTVSLVSSVVIPPLLHLATAYSCIPFPSRVSFCFGDYVRREEEDDDDSNDGDDKKLSAGERIALSRPTLQRVSSNLSVSSIATTQSLPLPSFVFIYAYLSFQFPCRLLLNFSLDMTIHFSVIQWWDTHPKRLLLRIRSFSFSSLSRSVFWIHTHTQPVTETIVWAYIRF